MVSVVLVTTVVGLTQQQPKVLLLISIQTKIILKQNICSASFYVTFSPSRSVRCETKKLPAMRVRIEGYLREFR